MKIIKTVISLLLTVMVVVPYSSVCFADGTDIDLFELLKSTELSSRDEFCDFLDQYGVNTNIDRAEDGDDEISFTMSLNESEGLITLDTVYEDVEGRTRATKSGKETHEVINQDGYLIYTIIAKGTFSYGSGYCNVTNKSGQFVRATGSFWTSTPSVTSGHVTSTKAYVKVSGTATCLGFTSRTYTLYLYCTSSGVLSSTFSGT